MNEAEVEYVIKGGDAFLDERTDTLGKLRFPKISTEANRCRNIAGILQRYASRKDKSEPKPLSVAVFGPPGSGKSRTVKEIAKSLGGDFVVLPTINLTQLRGTVELSEAIKKGGDIMKAIRGVGAATKGVIPIFFFDEFDAPLEGVSRGWLRWFLAPMQDGEVMLNGTAHTIGKAVFMFAGGTAATLVEFEERARNDEAAYREQKVPDFISRLRGNIDIEGLNDGAEKPLRRALVLRHVLEERWADAQEASGAFPIDRGLVGSLISNAHYLHGARSMEAFLEMSSLRNGTIERPEEQLGKLHVSRGELDGKLIGVSAGLKHGKGPAADLLGRLTKDLLDTGAKVAYGGDFFPEGTLERLIEAAKDVPKDLYPEAEWRIRNYLGMPSYSRGNPFQVIPDDCRHLLDVIKLRTLSSKDFTQLELPSEEWFPALNDDQKEDRPNSHLAWAVSLFRLRVREIQDIDALIVFGGKDGGSWGRFPGVAEEVMLALTFGKPVYILGGVREAAYEVGKLLGLSHTIENPDECLAHVEPLSVPPSFERAFELPNLQLPKDIRELRDFFFRNSLTSEAWPWNGLRPEENRKLFCLDVTVAGVNEMIDLILQGLKRLEWESPPVVKGKTTANRPGEVLVRTVNPADTRSGAASAAIPDQTRPPQGAAVSEG